MMYGQRVLAAAALRKTNGKDSLKPTENPVPQPRSQLPGDVILLDSKISDQSYWLTDIEINLALYLMRQQWPDVCTQDCLHIQRPFCFNQVVKHGVGLYAQVMNKPQS